MPALTDGNRAVANANLFRRALAYAKDFDMLIVQHAEEPTLATGVMNASEMASRLGLSGNPSAAEVIMIERDLRLVEMTGARYHVAQISCAASLPVIRAANRHVHWVDTDRHGYGVLDITPARAQMDYYTLSDKTQRNATSSWSRAFPASTA